MTKVVTDKVIFYLPLYLMFTLIFNDLGNELNSLNMVIDIKGRQICCLLYADDIVIFSNTAN